MVENYKKMEKEELIKLVHVLKHKNGALQRNYSIMCGRCIDLKGTIIVIKKQLENITKNIHYNKDTKTQPTKVVYYKSGTDINIAQQNVEICN